MTGADYAGELARNCLDVMEESAARVPGELAPLARYVTDSGVVTCKALRSPFRFAYQLEAVGDRPSVELSRKAALAHIESRIRRTGLS